MKLTAPLLVAAALIAAAPTLALADPPGQGEGRGRGDGGAWRQGGWPRGEGGPDAGGGRWGDGRFQRGGDGDPRQGGGRFDRGWTSPDGPVYAGPQSRNDRPSPNSLNEDLRGQQDEARQGFRQGRFVGLGRVLPEIGRRYPGRQLDAGLEDGAGGRPVYRVRWAGADGRRIDVIVDAQTGAILSTEGR